MRKVFQKICTEIGSEWPVLAIVKDCRNFASKNGVYKEICRTTASYVKRRVWRVENAVRNILIIKSFHKISIVASYKYHKMIHKMNRNSCFGNDRFGTPYIQQISKIVSEGVQESSDVLLPRVGKRRYRKFPYLRPQWKNQAILYFPRPVLTKYFLFWSVCLIFSCQWGLERVLFLSFIWA